MSTPQATVVSSDPTKRVYVDNEGIRMFLSWGRRMPKEGRLGDVTYGSFQKKPIQVFDAIENEKDHSKTWQFQAQDGSFLCSMFVSADQNVVTFLNNRKGNFPQITVDARFP